MTLDATVAGASANSYIDLAAADVFAASIDSGPEAIKWLEDASTDAECERALQRATSEIDSYVKSGWPRYSTTQALQFPRSIDAPSGSPVIPSDIKKATYHQAAYVLKNATIIDKANARHARGLSQYSEPNNSGSLGDGVVNIISPHAMHYLADFDKATPSRARGLGSARFASGFSS